MMKLIAIATLTLTSVSAMAADTLYIRDFDNVISKTRIIDDEGYRIGNYEARFVGKTLTGSSHPNKMVDVRLRTMIEYYGSDLSHSQEVVRTAGAESCLNMANQLRLSANNTLALKLTIPSVGVANQETAAREYLVDHFDGDVSHNHMGFECELVLPPGPVTQFDGSTDWASQAPSQPTRY